MLPISDWVAEWAGIIQAGGYVLDLAAGSGRHTQFFAEAGYKVEAVDRDISRLSVLALHPSVHVFEYDLELGSWPYSNLSFDGIVVTNYLHRPLFPALIEALSPGGILIYETFAMGNERYGRPSNPEFLLHSGELLEIFQAPMRVLAFEDVYTSKPNPAMVQRICVTRTSDWFDEVITPIIENNCQHPFIFPM